MIETQPFFETPSKPQITPATDEQILQYLRHSYKFAEVAVSTEREAFIIETCDRLNIQVSDEEWQAGGDAFRIENKLLDGSKTQNWLAKQRINVEKWSQGIKIQLLTKKLREHLFGKVVDGEYLSNRENFRRVALSQIIVTEPTEAMKIAKSLREGEATFCALALEHSRGKQSHENGGFIGVRFLPELNREIKEAIAQAKESEIVGPIQTRLGYHILRVEKWYQLHLNEKLREQLLESFFQGWLREQMSSAD
jgi:PPIC-type PPIASE domain